MKAHKLTYKVLEGEFTNQLESLFLCMNGTFGDMISLNKVLYSCLTFFNFTLFKTF